MNKKLDGSITEKNGISAADDNPLIKNNMPSGLVEFDLGVIVLYGLFTGPAVAYCRLAAATENSDSADNMSANGVKLFGRQCPYDVEVKIHLGAGF
jgi:hypothetical protein